MPELKQPEKRELNKFTIDKDGKCYINGMRINFVRDYTIKFDRPFSISEDSVPSQLITLTFAADIEAELIDRDIHIIY